MSSVDGRRTNERERERERIERYKENRSTERREKNKKNKYGIFREKLDLKYV